MECLEGGPVGAGAGDAAVSVQFVARWKEAIERDQAQIEAARQQREMLLSRHRAAREKARVLLCSLADGSDGQGLLADLDAIEAGIRETFGEPCSPTGS